MNIEFTYLIDANELLQETLISETTDILYINPIIQQCQDAYIEPIIGSALMDEIKGQIQNGNLSVNNEILTLKYIRPALRLFVVSEWVLYNTFKIQNKGTLKKTSENGFQPETQDIYTLRNSLRNQAQLYSKKLFNHLKANASLYPLYQNPPSGCDVIQPLREFANSTPFSL